MKGSKVLQKLLLGGVMCVVETLGHGNAKATGACLPVFPPVHASALDDESEVSDYKYYAHVVLRQGNSLKCVPITGIVRDCTDRDAARAAASAQIQFKAARLGVRAVAIDVDDVKRIRHRDEDWLNALQELERLLQGTN